MTQWMFSSGENRSDYTLITYIPVQLGSFMLTYKYNILYRLYKIKRFQCFWGSIIMKSFENLEIMVICQQKLCNVKGC